MRVDLYHRVKERRKKRLITPALYFIAEMIFIWLVLSLIQLNFNIKNWAMWSYIVLVIFGLYALAKTIHVYKRQKRYKS